MNGPYHYERAEYLIGLAADLRESSDDEHMGGSAGKHADMVEILAEAQVHATLAQAAAAFAHGDWSMSAVRAWNAVLDKTEEGA